MTQHAQFPQVFPALHHLPSFSVFLLANDSVFQSRIIDITDPLSGPSTPIPDFEDALNISATRSWRLSWSVRLLTGFVTWAGTNRADLYLRTLNYTRGIQSVIPEASEDLIRLFIPARSDADYVYTGSRIVHSQQARIEIENRSGDGIFLDIDLWAKAW